MRKKLTPYNRIQAIIRTPEYKKDYDEFSKLKMFEDSDYFEKENKLLKKWKLKFPLDPKKSITENQQFASTGEFIAKPIPFKKNLSNTFYLEDKRYLTIQIDLTNTREKIKKAVDLIVEDFQSILPKDKGRDRKAKKIEVDHWEIFNMYKIEGINFSEIARRLSGLKGNPSYNDELKLWRKCVKEAYDKALKMIEQVEQEVKAKNKLK